MEHKNWHKKINTIALTFIALLPSWLLLFELFRNGFDSTSFNSILSVFSSMNNPISSILHDVLVNVFELGSDSLTTVIISTCFGWFIFVEMFEIIVMALFYFIDVLKSFFNRKENSIL